MPFKPELFTFAVLAVLRHNGTRYAPDDPDHNTVDLTLREAEPLQKLKVISGTPIVIDGSAPETDGENGGGEAETGGNDTADGNAPDAEPDSGKEPAAGQGAGDPATGNTAIGEQPAAPSSDGREQAIATAIASLNPETDFTQAGTPKVKAVELAAGFDVTADDVAAAWETLKPAE